MAKRRAVISCADKTGLADFALGLTQLGWEIVSTGGTYRKLKESGVTVREVSEITGFPEMLDGRVKTLHPKIHGGILARRDRENDMRELEANGVEPVDMIVCNLYPFIATAQRHGVTLDELIEEIDIGGPTLLRASAKNYKWVIVITDPQRYPQVLNQLRDTGDVDLDLRKELALEVFNHTSQYDSAIASYLGDKFKNS